MVVLVHLTDKDIDAHECNGSLLSRDIVCARDGANDGNDELRYAHPHGAHEEQVATSHSLNEIQAWERAGNVDSAAG